MNRREFIRTAVATTTLVAVAATGVFEVASKVQTERAVAQQQAGQVQLPPVTSASGQLTTEAPSSSSSQAAATAPAGYFLVAQLSSLAGKTSAYFTHPTYGHSILLELNGTWRAFSATCTHRPCTLEFVSSELYCPCHGATFDASSGSVTRGPAQVSLGEYGVLEQNGAVYVSTSVIN